MPAARTPRPSPITALVALRKKLRQQGKKLVFTNGVFDVLHRGHVDLLNKAQAFGDVLIVGLNSDRSVKRLKGAARPINRQSDRAAVLLALRAVDYVCIFDEDTPLRLVSRLKPDVLVKGGEYPIRAIVGADIVLSAGGRVRRIKMRPGYSTTRLVNQLSQSKPTL